MLYSRPAVYQMNVSEPKDTDTLEAHVGWYTMQDYVVESQTETDALLVKPKGEFSVGWFMSRGVSARPNWRLLPGERRRHRSFWSESRHIKALAGRHNTAQPVPLSQCLQ